MPNNKPCRTAPRTPDATSEYEAAGIEVLTTHTRAEMRKSTARLKRALRWAFAVEQERVGEAAPRLGRG